MVYLLATGDEVTDIAGAYASLDTLKADAANVYHLKSYDVGAFKVQGEQPDNTADRLLALPTTNEKERAAVALTVDLLRREGLEAYNGEGVSLVQREAQVEALVHTSQDILTNLQAHRSYAHPSDAFHFDMVIQMLRGVLAPFEQE